MVTLFGLFCSFLFFLLILFILIIIFLLFQANMQLRYYYYNYDKIRNGDTRESYPLY
jgi:hypothetical protein